MVDSPDFVPKLSNVVSFRFNWFCFVSFRFDLFVSIGFVSFRSVSFCSVSLLFRFALYRGPLYFSYILFMTYAVCVSIFMSSLLGVALFCYTATAGSRKVGPVERLTTPVGWL